MSLPPLQELEALAPGVLRPQYDRKAHGVGILHLGLGAFHRAHQAVATDDALAAAGGNWRIIGANLRSRDVPDAMAAQDGLYTVLIRDALTIARIIGAHAATIGSDPAATLAAAKHPDIRILSLTVSEKAYGIDRVAMDIDPTHPAIAADLQTPNAPHGALGLIVAALSARREAGIPPFTVLCCDNLPDNGMLLRAGVLGFAKRVSQDLADWIAEYVAFPATMVDRITPASSADTFADAARLTGYHDAAAVETEPFTQWVIEDNFPQGRPMWEAGGAQFVKNVAPYETMKLRMLNGSHSLIAYMGRLLGLSYVRDVVAEPKLRAAILRHMSWAAGSLEKGLDTKAYTQALLDRFANPAIAHATRQIAMDATQKLPQRWFAPALVMPENRAPLAFALAVWLAYLIDLAHKNEAPDDPKGAQILALTLENMYDIALLYDAIISLHGLAPDAIIKDNLLKLATLTQLDLILKHGINAALENLP